LTRISHAIGGGTGGARVMLARRGSLWIAGTLEDTARIEMPTPDSNAQQCAPHAVEQQDACV